jgi:hypothetical protein
MTTARSNPWWRLLAEGGAEDLGDPAGHVDDPWADRVLAAPGLTAAQRAHLGALDDQPPVPRLSADDAEHEEDPR